MEVTASDEDIIRDQNERSGLQRAIADVEMALRGSTPGTRRILENSLEGMKGRVASLDKKISDAIKEREVYARAEAATVAMLAEKETRLNESEKHAYSSFLAEDFFTKKDFGKLDEFYSHSWDRLTEGGKEEMSHRVWEGVRHHEFEFSDLPRSVQDKEAKRAYSKLAGSSIDQSALAGIPEADRKDFVAAYQTGNREEVGRVLDRDSFRQNIALETEGAKRHKRADLGHNAEDDRAMTSSLKGGEPRRGERPVTAADPSSMADLSVDSLNLSGVKLVDATSSPSVAAIPDASGARLNVR